MCRIAGAARLGCVPHTLAADVSKVTDGVEENIGGALTFYRLLRQHHKHLKSINLSNG